MSEKISPKVPMDERFILPLPEMLRCVDVMFRTASSWL